MQIPRGVLLACLLAPGGVAQDVSAIVNTQLPGLVETYKSIHAHPELSHHEERTSARLAQALRKEGFEVTERVGKYPDGGQAYGIAAILKNGPGPELLIRADMDALPIVEETGVSYASHVRATNASGQEVGVMHACGHDVHTTTLMGTAHVMAALKDRWHGTLLLIGQPSEETIDGAKAMLADHLYERFGTPNFAIALHDSAEREAGTVSITSGPALASATSVDVTMRGISGHGAMPQLSKDPIVMAAEFIMQLQTIVSRQEDPSTPTVVTVGDIHGGTRRNIIPTEVKLELTTRSFTDRAREIALDGIRRTAQGVALSAGVSEDRAPVVTVLENESTPALYNDPALTARGKAALAAALGAQNVFDVGAQMVSEDFGMFGLEGHKIPTFMFWLNAMDATKVAAARAKGEALPGPHNSRFEPSPEPTLRAGMTAMTAVALNLLAK
jgi:hippurate hydrolase